MSREQQKRNKTLSRKAIPKQLRAVVSRFNEQLAREHSDVKSHAVR